MSDIPNREELEAELARKLGRLFKVQMSRLIEELGDPPSMENVSAAFWEESGEEFNRIVIPFLEQLYLDQAARALAATPVGVDWALVNSRAIDWARGYGYNLVRGINSTTANVIRRALAAYFEQGLTIGELEKMLSGTFGPVRAEMIAVTEITRAASQGEMALAEEIAKYGIQMVEIWNTNNDELVCLICGPRNQKPRGDGWNDPPPAHPRCRCFIGLQIPEPVNG